MARKVLAVITALITSFAIILTGWMVSQNAPFSSMSYAQYASYNDWLAYANSAPPLYWAIGLTSYALAGFAGGWIVSKMARRWSSGGYALSMLVAAILTVFSVGVYFAFPGPVWFLIGTIVIFVPTAALAHRMAEGPAHMHLPETV
ncbi:MAG TPA: hypothetical protein VGI80_03105 [Pyrinomonadaceae bacterium]|jgi:hypothetical protein